MVQANQEGPQTFSPSVDQIQVTSAQELDHVLVTVPQPPSDKVRMDDTLKLDITGLGIPSFPRARQQVVFKGTEHTDACRSTRNTRNKHGFTPHGTRGLCGTSNRTQRAWVTVRDAVFRVCEAAECIHRHCAHRCVQQSTRNTQNKHGFTRPNAKRHGSSACGLRCGTSKLKRIQTRNGTQRACMNGCSPGPV